MLEILFALCSVRPRFSYRSSSWCVDFAGKLLSIDMKKYVESIAAYQIFATFFLRHLLLFVQRAKHAPPGPKAGPLK